MTNPDKIFDSWLVVQTQSGNKKAITLLVKRWHKKLCRQAYWYTKDLDTAKDIVQDCWPIIIKRIDQVKDGQRFGSWALTIVTRKAIDLHRKNNREHKSLEAFYKDHVRTTYDPVVTDDTSLKMALTAAMNTLPSLSRQVLNLFYLEELSIQTISEILGLPKGTVKSRLFTAREKLKVILKHRNHEK